MPSKKRSSRELASEELIGHEGFKPKVYEDIKGIPSIGYGFNLNEPEIKGILAANGYDPEKLKSGEQQITEKDSMAIKRQLVDMNARALEKKFEGIDLTPNEMAALISLRYNSPSLIGPNLTKYITQGDKVNAAKEIMLRSNAEKNRGLARRRLKEASLFSDGNPLPNVTDTEIQPVLEALGDDKETINQYPILNRSASGYPYYKIKESLKVPMTPIPEINPITGLPAEMDYIAPSDTMDQPAQSVTDQNELDKYDLLKNFRRKF